MQYPVSTKLIEWMQKHDPMCPRVSTKANETTKQNTFGRRAVDLVLSEKLSVDDYADLIGVEAPDNIRKGNEMNTAEKIYNGSRIVSKTPSSKYSEETLYREAC